MRFLCTRQFQNRIEESVYTLLKIQIERFGLQEKFKILQNKIICTATGSEFIFYGLWKSVDEIKSLEDIDVHWAEEAHLLSKPQWDIIDPTLRGEGSEHWIIFNPRLVTDFVYKRFVTNPPRKTVVRHINYDENPFCSQTFLDLVEEAKEEDYENYCHVYLGHPLSDSSQSIIKRSHIMAAIDAHKKLSIEILGTNTLGFDVADDGGDGCAIIQTFGNCAVWSEEWNGKSDELMKSSLRAWQEARNRNADIVYDAHGLGAFTGSKLNEINESNKSGVKVKYTKFFSGGAVLHPEKYYLDTKVKNKHFFSNRKSQTWWSIADRFRNTYNAVNGGEKFDIDEMIFIDGTMPNLNKLIDELCTPNKDFDNAGRVKVESKKDLKKRGISSPNLADAFCMAFDKTGISNDAFTITHFWK